GVLGGATPLAGGAVIDVCRMTGIVSINEIDRLVTVRAGMNGMAFERALNELGWTTGHLPQSIEISTVGGWAACRGAGQASTRYGKIEDIVVGLKAVLPNGELLEVRPVPRRSTGPSIRDLIVGSEGTLGVITELTLRIWRKPEVERGLVVGFPSLNNALAAMRDVLQAEIRPAVVRVYDDTESRQRLSEQEHATAKILTILEFHGTKSAVEHEVNEAMRHISAMGGQVLSDAPWKHWRENRYKSLSKDWQDKNYYMDTIEVTGRWSALGAMYERMRAAAINIHPDVYFAAHWSHAYVEGACQYMTIRLPPMDQEAALPLHARLWDAIQSLTLELDGSIAHHHGAGFFRNKWMKRELGSAGLDVLQQVKNAIDPRNLFNPGKLGLSPAPLVSRTTDM
ncbi:FAD-binding oxidoreductase, partial [Escherichia coli]|nr:FAD-binding oxidoreductase [Escherichia coli]